MEYRIGSVVFNDWVITKELGEGATGKVYEIEKNGFETSIKSALKVIRIPKTVSDIQVVMSEGMDEESVTGYFQEFVDEILHEIEVMVSLKEHPNIITYEDHCVIPHEDGIGWDILIKMELLTSLTEWQLNHTMTEESVVRLGYEISSALAYAREHGLIHRDVKPENIFVDSLGRFKLGDFGIARTIEKTTGGLSKKGTESYMAPEVYLGKRYNEQVDIYSLGIVLYRFLNNNRLPFYPPVPEKISYSSREEALMKRMQGLPFPEPQNGSTELKRIILKACEYLPENRYASMNELHNDLQKLKTGDGGEDQGDDTVGDPGPMGFKIGKWLIAGTLSICALVGIVFGMNQKKVTIVESGQSEAQSDVTEEKVVSDSSYASQTDMAENIKIEKGDWYYITCSYEPGIAMRSEPFDESELLCRLPYGTEFYVETFSGTWGYTTVNDISGWIEMKYAESTRNRDGIEETKTYDLENWYYISNTYDKGIAVRSEPTGKAELLTRIPYGTEFHVKTIYKGWGYTTVNGATGWIELDCADKLENKSN